MERELRGANFEAKAPAKPFLAPERKVVALFITGPMLPVADWIFAAISSLMNFEVADCDASMPYAAFFNLFDWSSTDKALVFESRKESSF